MALILKKGSIFDLLFTFSSHQGKVLQHISYSHTYTYFVHPIDLFCLTNFEKHTNLSGMFLFGMIPGVDPYSRHFGTIINNNMVSKFKMECLLLICTYTNAKGPLVISMKISPRRVEKYSIFSTLLVGTKIISKKYILKLIIFLKLKTISAWKMVNLNF